MFTFPPSAKTFVPLEFSVPIDEYHSGPFKIIWAMLAYVSTLLINVGLPHKPTCAGYGGFTLGWPLFPSIDSKSAVSSPHTKAPAPSLISISKEKSVPNIFLPSMP